MLLDGFIACRDRSIETADRRLAPYGYFALKKANLLRRNQQWETGTRQLQGVDRIPTSVPVSIVYKVNAKNQRRSIPGVNQHNLDRGESPNVSIRRF